MNTPHPSFGHEGNFHLVTKRLKQLRGVQLARMNLEIAAIALTSDYPTELRLLRALCFFRHRFGGFGL